MISAFGVEHGEISKSDTYAQNKKKGDTARNVGLAGLGVGAANSGVAMGRAYNANKEIFRSAARMGLTPPASSLKVPAGAAIHKPIALGALGAVGGGLVANRVYRRRQKKEANSKLG